MWEQFLQIFLRVITSGNKQNRENTEGYIEGEKSRKDTES